jgi:peptide deformylase
MTENSVSNSLPDYIIWNEQTTADSVIRTPAGMMEFPLTEQDKADIETLDKKYELELLKQGCAGLAAPQIGISKQFIIFALQDDPRLKKWRPDLTQTMPKSIWLNPSWEPFSHEMSEAFEACFTIPETSGPVKRYTKIKYKAYDTRGNLLEGTAEGFLARVTNMK